jgi:hypothetical protein
MHTYFIVLVQLSKDCKNVQAYFHSLDLLIRFFYGHYHIIYITNITYIYKNYLYNDLNS